MRVLFEGRGPFALLFAPSRREQHLTRYAVREHARGRALAAVLDDPYVRNRTTPAERARLLERPEVVAAVGRHAIGALRLELATRDRRRAATSTDGPARVAPADAVVHAGTARGAADAPALSRSREEPWTSS